MNCCLYSSTWHTVQANMTPHRQSKWNTNLISLFRPTSMLVHALFCITPPPTLIHLHILPLVIVHTAPGWWTSGEDPQKTTKNPKNKQLLQSEIYWTALSRSVVYWLNPGSRQKSQITQWSYWAGHYNPRTAIMSPVREGAVDSVLICFRAGTITAEL